MKRKKRIVDQIYNGAFNNLEIHPDTKKVFWGSGLIILIGILINQTINKRNEL